MTREKFNKQAAIRFIKAIQNGELDRYENLDNFPRSNMAIEYWDNHMFSYGMEYGAIMALMKVYNIQKDEL